MIWKCLRDHLVRWDTSPHLPNGRNLVDYRVANAYFNSGILPVVYERLFDELGVGVMTSYMQDQLRDKYMPAVQEEADASCQQALQEEMACDAQFDSIAMMSDARHGFRRNSRQTDVVAIGAETHKVIRVEVVTKDDDEISQRHEAVGTEKLYDYFESVLDGAGVHIKVHAHDRNVSVNKIIKKRSPDTQNQNDTWHVAKSVEKTIKPISSGYAKMHGKTWHEELYDKVSSTRTHSHWAMRNCEGSADKLRKSLLNIVEHYKNNHNDCHPSSRCKTDVNYKPSKVVIQSKDAQRLFIDAIMKTPVYKNAEDFVLAMDTFYVESFNNCLNVYHDKRIAFQNPHYIMRTNLTILHWNENVNRDYTSVWIPFGADITNPRQAQGKKAYKPLTFHFKKRIWNRYMDKVFSDQ